MFRNTHSHWLVWIPIDPCREPTPAVKTLFDFSEPGSSQALIPAIRFHYLTKLSLLGA